MRTQQTAQLLFKELSKTHYNVILTKEAYQGLSERNLGAWEGQLKDESYTKAESTWRALSAANKFLSPEVEGGESYNVVAARALSALQQIHQRYTGNTVLAITSFNTINAIAIQLNHLCLPSNLKTPLPKLHLSDGGLVLLETAKNLGFDHTQVVSHIKND